MKRRAKQLAWKRRWRRGEQAKVYQQRFRTSIGRLDTLARVITLNGQYLGMAKTLAEAQAIRAHIRRRREAFHKGRIHDQS